MITGTKKNEPRISDKTTKEYYVIMDDGELVGVSTTIEMARSCLDAYASRRNGVGKLEGMDVYVYEDSSGAHMITIRAVSRMKMG